MIKHLLVLLILVLESDIIHSVNFDRHINVRITKEQALIKKVATINSF